MACVQVTLVLVVSLTWLGVTLPGSAVPMAAVAVLDAILGMACGLCRLVVPRDHMTAVLRWLSDILPLSYAVDAMRRITAAASLPSAISADIAVILAFTIAALVGGAFRPARPCFRLANLRRMDIRR
jgi:ABC-2 type transport system permease protein